MQSIIFYHKEQNLHSHLFHALLPASVSLKAMTAFIVKNTEQQKRSQKSATIKGISVCCCLPLLLPWHWPRLYSHPTRFKSGSWVRVDSTRYKWYKTEKNEEADKVNKLIKKNESDNRIQGILSKIEGLINISCYCLRILET